MTTTVHKDTSTLTMSFVAHFDASVERIWEMWANPRLLERWWGPPTYPATFEDHDLSPGGQVSYFMTGPDGDTPRGWWRVITVDAPTSLTFEDGFADDDGSPVADSPVMQVQVSLEAADSGTTMTVASRFESLKAMEAVLAMGAEEGMLQAIAQINGLLDESA